MISLSTDSVAFLLGAHFIVAFFLCGGMISVSSVSGAFLFGRFHPGCRNKFFCCCCERGVGMVLLVYSVAEVEGSLTPFVDDCVYCFPNGGHLAFLQILLLNL
jgi:hypothetical protein